MLETRLCSSQQTYIGSMSCETSLFAIITTICRSSCRRINHVKFLAFHGNQLEYNGNQSANGAGQGGRIQPQGRKISLKLIQSFIKQLTLLGKQCFFHACNKSDHLQLRPEAAVILQFLHCLGNVTSWNIRLYLTSLKSMFTNM